jgi:hypothetical protein
VKYQNSEACQEAILVDFLTAPNINARTKRFYYYETETSPRSTRASCAAPI